MRVAQAIAGLVLLAGPGVAWAQQAPSAHTYATRYDAARRVTGTIAPDPDGTGPLRHAAVRNSYDAAGRLIRVETGELSAWKSEDVAPIDWGAAFTVHTKVETAYDAMSRKTEDRVFPGTALTPVTVTQYSYNNQGLLECTAVRMNPAVFGSLPASACSLGKEGSQGPDRITRNWYDAAGQLVRVERAVGTPLVQDYAKYEYTPNGKRRAVIDANNNRAEMTYDGFDRQARWVFPSKTTAGQVNAADYEEYGYDANNNRTSLRKRDGQVINYRYDALNRVDYKYGAPVDATYTYDLQGHQLTALQVGDGRGITNTYTGFGELASTTTTMGGGSRTLTYQYDANGNRTRITHPDGVSFTYSYDGLDRELRVFDATGGELTLFGYNAQGRRASGFGGGQQFGYDGIGRLTKSWTTWGRPYDLNDTFAYNPASQMVSRTRGNDAYAFTGAVNVDRAYARNGLNQYTSAGPATFSYDANGNLTGDGTLTYAYDPENRLLSAKQGSTTKASLSYDPLGRLHQVSGGTAGTTRFVYDGDQLVAEYNSSNVLVRRYVHGAGEDDPLVWYEGAGLSQAERRYLVADHQGSVVLAFDSNFNQIALNTYDEYGIPGANNAGRFQYTGQAWIPQLGMYHYKARVYSPTLGRFLQTDPIGYDDQINLYAYVANDPVNGRDPDGKQTVMGPVYDGLDRATAACGGDAQCGLKAWNQIQQGVAENVAIAAATELSGAAIIRGVGWTAQVAMPVVRLMRTADHFKPVAAGMNALAQRAAAVQSGLGRLAAGEGRLIAGPGAKDAFRGAEAAAQKYGGNAADYTKISVSEVTKSGDRVSIHAVRNEATGDVFEKKVIYGR